MVSARMRSRMGRQLDLELLLAFAWQGHDGDRLLVAVNYAPNQSQCYVRLPYADLAGRVVRLQDLMGPAVYDRDGSDLTSGGLYLDLPPWGYHGFEGDHSVTLGSCRTWLVTA